MDTTNVKVTKFPLLGKIREAAKKYHYINSMSLGATFLFCSWVAQNYYQNDWISRRIMMEHYASLGNSTLARSDQYFIMHMSERDKQKPNIEVLRNSGRIYVTHSIRALEILEKQMRWYLDPIRPSEIHYATLKQEMNKLFDSSISKEKIIDIVDQFVKEFNVVHKVSNEEVTKKALNIIEKEEFYNNLFVVLYIIGATLTSFGYITKQKYAHVVCKNSLEESKKVKVPNF